MKQIDGAWHAEKQSEVAEVYGVSAASVNKWRQAGMPGRPKAYPLGQITTWLRTRGPWQPRQVDDPLLVGGDETQSPALERYRDEQAQIARLKRLEMERTLVPLADVQLGLDRIAAVLRSTGEQLGRQFGGDAQDLLNEALDDAQREIDALCSPDDSDRDDSR